MPKVPKIYTENLFVRVTPDSAKFIRSHVEKVDVSLSFFVDEFVKRLKANPQFFTVQRPLNQTEIKLMEKMKKRRKLEWTRKRNLEKRMEAGKKA